jgi:Leucine-rich repeat (LRR) protein
MSLFSRRVFGGSPDSFKLLLEYGSSNIDYSHTVRPHQQNAGSTQVRLPLAIATLEFEFNSDESESAVAERFVQKTSTLLLSRVEERVVVKFVLADNASISKRLLNFSNSNQLRLGFHKAVSLDLSIACQAPVLRCMQFTRVSGTGNASDAALQTLLSHCDLSTIWKIKVSEGFPGIWTAGASTQDWAQLRNMNLSHCGLLTLTPTIGSISALRILRLSYNKLTTLPVELHHLHQLEVLAADHNLITNIPGTARRRNIL